jgi:hypothetical protein
LYTSIDTYDKKNTLNLIQSSSPHTCTSKITSYKQYDAYTRVKDTKLVHRPEKFVIILRRTRR